MTDITTAEREIREALAAGPTSGIWIRYDNDPGTFQVATVERFGIYSSHAEWGGDSGTPESDSAYVAACNPANIRAILDELTRMRAAQSKSDREWYGKLEAADAEIVRLRAENEALRSALLRLMQNFPTDSNLADAGWLGSEIDEACEAYDHAKAVFDAARKGEA